jgi:hypothetical protein
MEHGFQRFAISCVLLTCVGIGLGCGDKDKKGSDAAVSGKSGTAGAVSDSGQSGGGKAGSSAGSAGMTQSTAGTSGTGASSVGGSQSTPPPEMPRMLGPADGVYCESDVKPPPKTCAVGSRCCPNDEGGTHQEVCTTDAKCPACDGVTCGQLLCDGPEDCSAGQFCCYSKNGSCKNNAQCTPANTAFESSVWINVECRARCVSDQRDPDHGIAVCKDDRDCPGKYKAGRCQPMNLGDPPNGLKVCSGG